MTNPYRAMIARMADELDHYRQLLMDDRREAHALATEARALLAQPVAEGPSADEWDALVVRAWEQYETVGYQGERFMYDSDFGNALDLVRQELARYGRPTPQPPADGEVAELVETLKGIAYWRRHGKPGAPAPAPFDIRQADRLDRAADLLERPTPQPVAVSERLPGPEDCDEQGRCWCFAYDGRVRGWTLRIIAPGVYDTHWLPANALPTPEATND